MSARDALENVAEKRRRSGRRGREFCGVALAIMVGELRLDGSTCGIKISIRGKYRTCFLPLPLFIPSFYVAFLLLASFDPVSALLLLLLPSIILSKIPPLHFPPLKPSSSPSSPFPPSPIFFITTTSTLFTTSASTLFTSTRLLLSALPHYYLGQHSFTTAPWDNLMTTTSIHFTTRLTLYYYYQHSFY